MAGRPYLAAPAATLEILKKYDLHTQKKFGQNFLIDAHVPEKITEAAQVEASDCIIEIGPGIGPLTQFLAQKAGKVLAVEIDARLIPVLEETLADFPNTEILQADILEVDLHRLIEEEADGRRVKIVANLPYYITTPILMTMLEAKLPAESYTVMVQKEVADRMQVGPGTKDYGALSLAVQYYARPEIVANVPPNCFISRPNVGSAVIRLTRYEKPPVQVEDEKKMFALIRASFNQRRKTLVNGLGNAANLTYSKEQVEAALEKMGLSKTIRGEALTLEQFAQLSNLL